MVVVVRYYGGTKLGTGGLARAYSLAAAEMLDASRIIETLICDSLRFTVPFSLYDQIMRIISRGEYRIASQDFADLVTMEVEIRKSQVETFAAQLTELTGGQIEITKNG